MRKVVHFLALILTAAVPNGALAQDETPFDWKGFYLGAHTGGGLGLVGVSNPFGPPIFGDTVRTPGLLAGGQAGYNWQFGSTVIGLEAEASWADMDGTNTCFAYSGFYNSSNCRTHIDALGTFTGRLGWALPFDGRTLLYGKGGLAWEHSRIDATANDEFGSPMTGDEGIRWGWTLGAGVERAISDRWSLRASYDFLSFADQDIATPASGFQTTPSPSPTLTSVPGRASDVAHKLHLFKLGANYRLGRDGPSGDESFIEALRPTAPPPALRRTEIKAGVRYVRGWGQFHKDLGIQNEGVTSLASRLTYDGSSTNGTEVFGRLDMPFGMMVKGVIGTGSGGGHLNDEDWGLPSPPFPAFVPYSNTLSSVDETIRYSVIDIGYNWWSGPDHKLTPFVGYTYFQQHMKAYGCAQIANPNSDCVPALPASLLGITEYDTWQALRLGFAGELALAPRVTLNAEAAYLPHVNFRGTDNHVLRSLISPEDGRGVGVQLEAILTYALTDAWSVGVGGRYWSMWTSDGTVNFGGTGAIIPMRYAAEQAHVLIEGSYRFDWETDPLP